MCLELLDRVLCEIPDVLCKTKEDINVSYVEVLCASCVDIPNSCEIIDMNLCSTGLKVCYSGRVGPHCGSYIIIFVSLS